MIHCRTRESVLPTVLIIVYFRPYYWVIREKNHKWSTQARISARDLPTEPIRKFEGFAILSCVRVRSTRTQLKIAPSRHLRQ